MQSVTGEKIMTPQNIDYTITINGLELGDPELTVKSQALAYPVSRRFIEIAYKATNNDARYEKNVQVGDVRQKRHGPALKEKRDNLLVQAVVSKPGQFDSVWDKGFEDYLTSGGRAIIEERKAKAEQHYE